MPKLAISCWLVYLGVAFGVRVIIQIRTTGHSGLVSLRKVTKPIERFASATFIAAMVVAVSSSALAAVRPENVSFRAWQLPTTVTFVGVIAYAAGLALTFAAQLAMGRSWRIGVDSSERTELVAQGLFRFVRNPIFTGMLLTAVALSLVCSSWLSWFGSAALLAALEFQVRGVEEPHLTRMHGEAYRNYAATVGRFLPGVGRGVR